MHLAIEACLSQGKSSPHIGGSLQDYSKLLFDHEEGGSLGYVPK